jgi:hypothetical protein
MMLGIVMATIVVLLLIALAIVYGTLPWTMTKLAQRQVLVAFCDEGTIKTVMQGKGFHHQFMAYKGHHLNDPRKRWFREMDEVGKKIPQWQVLTHDDRDENYDDRPWFMKTAGVYWIGLPPFFSVYWYDFEWREEHKGRKGLDRVWHRQARTDFAYAKAFPYLQEMVEVEDREGLALNVVYQTTLIIKNAWIALFRNEDWLALVSGSLDSMVKNYVGAHTYKELISETKETAPGDAKEPSSHFAEPLIRLTNSLPDDKPGVQNCGLLGRRGVEVESADFLSVDPTDPKIREATQLAYVKSQEALGIVAIGEATATARVASGKAEASVIEDAGKAHAAALGARLSVLKDAGRLGELMLQTDAMMADGPGKRVIWANNPFIRENGLDGILTELGLTSAQDLKEILAKAMGGTK